MRVTIRNKRLWAEFHTDDEGVPLFWTLMSERVIVRVDLKDYERRCEEAGIQPATDAVRLDFVGYWYKPRANDGETATEGEIKYQDFDPHAWADYIEPLPDFQEEDSEEDS